MTMTFKYRNMFQVFDPHCITKPNPWWEEDKWIPLYQQNLKIRNYELL